MERNWVKIAGGITAPQGYRANAVAAGLKPSGGLDLTLIVSDQDAVASGVVTTSVVKAACVSYAQDLLAKKSPVRAILINAGQANACTGLEGAEDNARLATWVAEAAQLDPNQVLIASTGVIGQRLAMDRIAAVLPALVHSVSAEGWENAAQAILTTDLVTKTVAMEAIIDGHPVRVGGMSKGSGMIHPNMATMLGFLTCDAKVSVDLWQQMVRRAADASFNQISVDGDTSTNDMFLALANGCSQAPDIHPDTPGALTLENMIHEACVDLAKAIARDGEGATKLLEIRVHGAVSTEEARQMARVIVSSPLVKSAVFGCDPNWGRVLAAAGRSGVNFDPQKIDVWLGSFPLMQAGRPLAFDRKAASAYLKNDPVTFELHLHQGLGEGVAWGCDLSYDYVRINAEYTT
jgi:glutamate N-acetyltransferase/amino-acid N-acetyltransferase